MEYPKLFLLSAILLWTLCFLLIGAVAWWSLTLALMLTAIALIGLIYSEMRRTPWMPICLSAIASASPALLPFAIASDFDGILPLFAGAALLIFGREILKDVQDQEIDGGYKWTIPLAYGSQAAKGLVVASVAAASAAVATVSPLVIAGGLCAAVGVLLMGRNTSPAATMTWLDAGAALVLATLAAFPP